MVSEQHRKERATSMIPAAGSIIILCEAPPTAGGCRQPGTSLRRATPALRGCEGSDQLLPMACVVMGSIPPPHSLPPSLHPSLPRARPVPIPAPAAPKTPLIMGNDVPDRGIGKRDRVQGVERGARRRRCRAADPSQSVFHGPFPRR